MYLWLDDQIDDPNTPERHVPFGWIGAKTALQACRIISKGKITRISFDHDLGPRYAGDGYLVARFIERRAFFGIIPRIEWYIHSANPVGRKNIELAMKHAESLWSRY